MAKMPILLGIMGQRNTYIEQDPSYDPETGFWNITSLEANEENNAILVVML
jgi:hypothetical protein